MVTALYWQREGEGDDLVLVHGWGMNGAVWDNTVDVLKQTYRVHIVDLPGYGHSAHCRATTIEETVQQLLKEAPQKAIWVGWSLGGLLATYIALHFPSFVQQLITVASSPKFAAEAGWRGIQPQVLKTFTEQLVDDFQLTVERFMALQAMGSPTARRDLKCLKEKVLSRPSPDPATLFAGLQMLASVDLRHQIADISMPMLRLYGRLDGLVPVKVAQDMDAIVPESYCHIFSDSSHAPFMTEPDAFCQQILSFVLSSGTL